MTLLYHVLGFYQHFVRVVRSAFATRSLIFLFLTLYGTEIFALPAFDDETSVQKQNSSISKNAHRTKDRSSSEISNFLKESDSFEEDEEDDDYDTLLDDDISLPSLPQAPTTDQSNQSTLEEAVQKHAINAGNFLSKDQGSLEDYISNQVNTMGQSYATQYVKQKATEFLEKAGRLKFYFSLIQKLVVSD